MIKNLSIKNFKSLKDTGELNLKPVTILTGLNGMGKSSLVQVLLLIRQSDDLAKGLRLRNGLANIGTASDALFQSAEKSEIEIQLNGVVWTFDASSKSDVLDTLSIDPPDYQASGVPTVFGDRFQYISADRVAQTEMHEVSYGNINKGFLGVRGEYTVHFLEAAQTGEIKIVVSSLLRHPSATEFSDLITQTNAWLSEITPNTRVITKQVTSEQIQLGFSFGQSQTNPFKPKNVGFGLSYMLSIVVALLASQPGSLIIIENPEAHLHPGGQAKLAVLIVKAARNGAQIILETHSDHILNGIRVMVRNFFDDTQKAIPIEGRGGIAHDDVSVLWFERNGLDFSTDIIPIQLEANARIKKAPKGFFDQMDTDLKKILGF